MADSKRFEEIFNQSTMNTAIKIFVDKETGVNYLWRMEGYAGGITPLLDKDGKVVVSEYKVK